jgi:hypothetical protein
VAHWVVAKLDETLHTPARPKKCHLEASSPWQRTDIIEPNLLVKVPYGSAVITVYNDNGNEFALKLFESTDEEEDEPEVSLGALQEIISILRLLKGQNVHPNIIEIIDDVQTGFENDGEEDAGAGTAGYISQWQCPYTVP